MTANISMLRSAQVTNARQYSQSRTNKLTNKEIKYSLLCESHFRSHDCYLKWHENFLFPVCHQNMCGQGRLHPYTWVTVLKGRELCEISMIGHNVLIIKNKCKTTRVLFAHGIFPCGKILVWETCREADCSRHWREMHVLFIRQKNNNLMLALKRKPCEKGALLGTALSGKQCLLFFIYLFIFLFFFFYSGRASLILTQRTHSSV